MFIFTVKYLRVKQTSLSLALYFSLHRLPVCDSLTGWMRRNHYRRSAHTCNLDKNLHHLPSRKHTSIIFHQQIKWRERESSESVTEKHSNFISTLCECIRCFVIFRRKTSSSRTAFLARITHTLTKYNIVWMCTICHPNNYMIGLHGKMISGNETGE